MRTYLLCHTEKCSHRILYIVIVVVNVGSVFYSKINGNNIVFHAGTKYNKNKELVTNGGRVLNIISKQQTLKKAKVEAYKLIKSIKCSNLFYRKDIGFKAIDK